MNNKIVKIISNPNYTSKSKKEVKRHVKKKVRNHPYSTNRKKESN